MVARNDKLYITMDELYAHLWDAHTGGEFAILDQSLLPRSGQMVYDALEASKVTADHLILDLGCGQGNHSIGLAQEFNCRVVGVERAETNLRTANHLASLSGIDRQVLFLQGDAQKLPLASGTVDRVWCRDMLVHVPAMEQALTESARVLKPGGIMVTLVTLATDLLTETEADRLFGDLGIITRNLWTETLEAALTTAGFRVISKEVIGGERLEFIEERDGQYSRELRRLSRMQRAEEVYTTRLGKKRFNIARALYTWAIYIMIGKLSDAIYTLQVSEPPTLDEMED